MSGKFLEGNFFISAVQPGQPADQRKLDSFCSREFIEKSLLPAHAIHAKPRLPGTQGPFIRGAACCI